MTPQPTQKPAPDSKMAHPVLIANPIYDVVFKYLMDDLRVARVILSTILGREVEELEFKQRERTARVPSLGVTIFRLDFSAVIKTVDGERTNVLIEIQKADSGEDIARFRRYLAENYYAPPPLKTSGSSRDLPENSERPGIDGDPDATPGAMPEEVSGELQEDSPAIYSETSLGANAPLLPILTIYILGFPLANLRGYSGINVRRDYYDAVSGEKIHVRDAFIEYLTHDSYVIQVSELKQRRRNKLERFLSIFEQMNLQAKGHLKLFHDVMDEEFQIILDRLARAALDKAIRDEMDVEDEYLDLLKRKERSHAEALEVARKELEEARAREEEARVREEEARAREEEARVREEEARVREEEARVREKEARAREEEARVREEEERRQKEEALAELAELKRRMGNP